MENLTDKVLVLDLDGVVNWRIPAQRAGIPILGHHNPDIYRIPIDTFPANREMYRRPLLKDIYDAIRHGTVPVFPDVARLLKELKSTVIYGSTGRRNTYPMVYSTYFSLKMAGILDKFDDIYFKPEGYTTTEGKTAALDDIRRQWDDDQIFVVDDNPDDLLRMAKTFQRIRFILMRDLTTKRLTRGINMEKDFPNVQINETLRSALLSV